MDDKKDNKEIAILNNVFNGSNLSFYINKKISRIVKAIYLVTNNIKDTEPIRSSLRQICVEKDFINIIVKDKKTALDLAQKITNLISLLDIALTGGFVSPMNRDILIQELEDLQTTLFDEHIENALSQVIPSKYFSIEKRFSENKNIYPNILKEFEKDQEKVVRNKQIFKGQYKRQDDVFYKNTNETNVDNLKDITNQSKDQGFQKTNLERREQIKNIIRNKGEVSIKDISIMIGDVSEKTIQRELNSMLLEGVLKKTGDRRWSRYSLVL